MEIPASGQNTRKIGKTLAIYYRKEKKSKHCRCISKENSRVVADMRSVRPGEKER